MVFNASILFFTFGVFAFDKVMAVVGIPIRIPNIILLFLFTLGVEAWMGCVAAMVLCWHKVRHPVFVVVGLIVYLKLQRDLSNFLKY